VSSTLADAALPAAIDTGDAAAWSAAFAECFAERKTNADAIADLALENFEEVSAPFATVALVASIPSGSANRIKHNGWSS
jgi:hypothetical protein